MNITWRGGQFVNFSFEMDDHILRNRLFRAIGSIDVVENLALSSLTTFRIGGPADFVVAPENVKELTKALDVLKDMDIPYIVIGRGSNILAADEGFRGAVIRLSTNYFQHTKVQDNIITAEAGVTLTSLARTALSHGLTGLEFASGIPGSLGGGIYMNAGAYGGELKDVIQEVTIVDYEGKIRHLDKSEMGFGHRSSILQHKSWICVSAALQLSYGDKDQIEERMKELSEQRKAKQPLELPSAGSVFKRPEGYFAGALIEQAGLKGYAIGGAQVSEKHAGFIVNRGGATCKDVVMLIRHIQKTVKEKFGVQLETEIRYLTPDGLDRIG